MLEAHTKSDKIRKFFLVTGLLLGWFALIGQFYLIIVNRTASVPETVIRYFSYFTILSNIMVALSFTLPLMGRSSAIAGFFSRPSTLTGVVLYIVTTCIVYNTILRPLSDFSGLQLVVDELLHTVIPVFFLLYWLFFVPKALLAWKNIWPWMIFPAVYCIYSLIRGEIAGFYPYPFLNADHLGYKQVFINCTVMVLLFGIVALVLVAVAKYIGRGAK